MNGTWYFDWKESIPSRKLLAITKKYRKACLARMRIQGADEWRDFHLYNLVQNVRYNIRTIFMFLDIIYCLVFCLKYHPVYISKHNVSETGFFQNSLYKPKQLNSSARAKRAFKLWRSSRIRPCTSDVSRLKSSSEKKSTSHGANLRKTKFSLEWNG
jgi:hypothetical protein